MLAGSGTSERVMRMMIYYELIVPQSSLMEPYKKNFIKKLASSTIFETSTM